MPAMTSLPSTGQEQPLSRDLQRQLSDIPHQTAASHSTSAYAASAVAYKVHHNPANTTASADNLSAVMSDAASNVHDSLNTQPVPDASSNVQSLRDEHAALTVSIPGQVEAQEHRCRCSLTPAYNKCFLLHVSALCLVADTAA